MPITSMHSFLCFLLWLFCLCRLPNIFRSNIDFHVLFLFHCFSLLSATIAKIAVDSLLSIFHRLCPIYIYIYTGYMFIIFRRYNQIRYCSFTFPRIFIEIINHIQVLPTKCQLWGIQPTKIDKPPNGKTMNVAADY